MDILIGLAIMIVLLALGFSAGTIAEKKHFAQLRLREQNNLGIVQTQSRIFLSPTPGGPTRMKTIHTTPISIWRTAWWWRPFSAKG